MIITNKKTSLKKPLLITAAVILILGLACVVYVYGLKGSIFGWSTSHSQITPNNNDAGAATSKPIGTGASQPTPSKTPNSSEQTQAPATQPDGSRLVDLSITSTSQTSSNYHIGVIIYSVEGNGTCTLTLSRQGYTTLSQTVGIQALASSTTCKGFDIPMSQLSAGTWRASIIFAGPSVNGSTAQDIQIN